MGSEFATLRRARIGVFGLSGAGKTTLCHALKGCRKDHGFCLPTQGFNTADVVVGSRVVRVWDVGGGADPTDAVTYITSFLPCDAVLYVIDATDPNTLWISLWEMFALAGSHESNRHVPWLVVLNTKGEISHYSAMSMGLLRLCSDGAVPPGVTELWKAPRILLPVTCTQRWTINTMTLCVRLRHRAVFSHTVCQVVASFLVDAEPSLRDVCLECHVKPPPFSPSSVWSGEGRGGHGFFTSREKRSWAWEREGASSSWGAVHRGRFHVMAIDCKEPGEATRCLQWVMQCA